MDNFKVGEIVNWTDSTYVIVGITKKGLILRQNFSIGTILKSEVPFEEVY